MAAMTYLLMPCSNFTIASNCTKSPIFYLIAEDAFLGLPLLLFDSASVIEIEKPAMALDDLADGGGRKS